jgi:hypothetical protein
VVWSIESTFKVIINDILVLVGLKVLNSFENIDCCGFSLLEPSLSDAYLLDFVFSDIFLNPLVDHIFNQFDDEG